MDKIIDFVVPYVDNQDKVWQKAYFDFCNRYNLRQKIIDIQTCRYADNLKLIEYQLKLVNKNMPWIRNIYLLLMNKEQAPKDLPSNVRIVYHGAFIPQQFLPTFNSTTIEMFLWNIKDLSEHFIYANDDMLPINPLQPSDFFEEDKVKIEWWETNINDNRSVFRYQSKNSYNHIAIRLHKKVNCDVFYRPAHSFTPMIKSHCKQAYDLIKDLITKHIRAFRTEYQYNQYIYPCYEKLTYGTLESTVDFLYTQCEKELDFDHDIICFNIIPSSKVKELKEGLDKIL